MNKLKRIGILVGLALTFYLGTQFGGEPTTLKHESESHTVVVEEVVWTCSMHPQIQMKEPGQCPVCGMDLIPLESGSTTGNDRQLVMNEWNKKLAEIVTAPVERKFVEATVRMVGKLVYDETKVKTISSWVDGRIERLYVDYTGIPVSKGDHLVELYSPDLLTGQEELIEARRRVDAGGKEKSEFLRNSDLRSLESAREKLRLWGLSESQVKAIESNKKSSDRILIESPQSGIVIHKALKEGDYVKTGTHIYTVADLDSLWVKLDAYESDLQWLHYGQDVAVETEAYPGEIFHGLISFIDPVLDDSTRTVKVRVNVENGEERLKPGMFVRATVHAKLAQGGKVMNPKLAGKWIGPMHPEVIQDGPGKCPVCKMDLVKAESLGYVSAEATGEAPLVVPATAVLRTGRRAVVYVEVEKAADSIYEGREIVLGARAGDYYLVRSGLAEGEQVVVNGNFNIDSALQIKAQPSMMSMEGDALKSVHEGSHSDAAQDRYSDIRVALAPIYAAYLDTQVALASDDLTAAQAGAKAMTQGLSSVKMELFSGDDHMRWMKLKTAVGVDLKTITGGEDMEAARAAFGDASTAVLELEQHFGHAGGAVYYEAFCPMAFDGKGGRWLQALEKVNNPFFGSDMLGCGSIENTFAGH